MMNLAPLIIFGYDRPIHISNMIHSLSKNSEAINSEAFIFIDGANDDTDIEAHQKVINKVSEKLPFKKTHVNVRKDNFGCKKILLKESVMFLILEITQLSLKMTSSLSSTSASSTSLSL